ncbi:MAG: hypothetical protein LUO89_02070 [Methanothrix sp.]|nr:hypothetical protein [Methanothrix sp.]
MKIDKELERKMAEYFAPIYFSSSQEYQYLVKLEPDPYPIISLCYPPWKPCIHFSIFKWNPVNNHDFYEINYLSIWDRDTGIRGHLWDTERTALLVKAPVGENDPSQFEVQEVYFAAHEGEGPLNRSKYIELPKVSGGIAVYWSLNKHGSYSSSKDAKRYLFIEGFKEPGFKADPKAYVLKDAGTIDQPLVPWIKYKEAWGPDGVSSVYSKLKDRIWSPIPGTSKWHRNLPGEQEAKVEIKKFQRALNLRATGNINETLFNQISTLPREVIRNAPLMDQDRIAEVMHLHPKELDAGQVAATYEVPVDSLRTPKTIDCDISGITGFKAINLGKLNSKTIIYGMIDPQDLKIVEIRKASIKTIKETKIKSSDLRKLTLQGT